MDGIRVTERACIHLNQMYGAWALYCGNWFYAHPHPPSIPSEKFRLLPSGYRMLRPPNSSTRSYEVIGEYWAIEPFRRPNFARLKKKKCFIYLFISKWKIIINYNDI